MEADELKKIWQTLSNEKIIDKSIAVENIQRIIKLKSCEAIEKLSKKLKHEYLTHLATALLVTAITIFATLFLGSRNQTLPVQGYVFLILVITFYVLKAVNVNSKLKLLNLSSNNTSILDSLKIVKEKFEKISTKESVILFVSLSLLTVFANVLINDKTNFSNYNINSLQGYVLIFSIIYIVSLPFLGKYYFNKRFSGILKDINNSIEELSSEE